jgi:hypothetical protein
VSKYPNADDDAQCPVCATWRTVYEDFCPECIESDRRTEWRKDSEERRNKRRNSERQANVR